MSAAARDNARRTAKQLRDARRRIEEGLTSEIDRRRAEDKIREQSHDERAITIRKPTTPRLDERRRGRTDVELRRDLEEIRRQWELKRVGPRKKPDAKTAKRPRKAS